MTCKLHLRVFYDPKGLVWSCRCGQRQIREIEVYDQLKRRRRRL